MLGRLEGLSHTRMVHPKENRYDASLRMQIPAMRLSQPSNHDTKHNNLTRELIDACAKIQSCRHHCKVVVVFLVVIVLAGCNAPYGSLLSKPVETLNHDNALRACLALRTALRR